MATKTLTPKKPTPVEKARLKKGWVPLSEAKPHIIRKEDIKSVQVFSPRTEKESSPKRILLVP